MDLREKCSTADVTGYFAVCGSGTPSWEYPLSSIQYILPAVVRSFTSRI